MIPLFGEPEGGKRETLEGRLIWLAIRALRRGINVVLDFGVWTKDERSALRFLATSVGASCELVHLEIDEVNRPGFPGHLPPSRHVRPPLPGFEKGTAMTSANPEAV